MEELYDMFPKPQTDEYGYAEGKFMKLEKVIQDLQAKANEIQLSTPSEIKTKIERKLEELRGTAESNKTME